MPNVAELAQKGTVFQRHYTAAPSTAMAFTSMFTGKYAYQTDRKKYIEVDDYEGNTLFDTFYNIGYEVHALWDQRYVYLAHKFSKCYGSHTIFHNVDWLTKNIQPHVTGKFDDLSFRPQYTELLLTEMENFLKYTVGNKDNLFLWIHFPHVLAGRNAYGSDMDVFDTIVGFCRKYFDDNNIFITADHGHMNGNKSKYGYGFDVNESAIRIPLIAPKLEGKDNIYFPTSNTQLENIIINRRVPKLPYVVSETAYYQQPHRKMAIIKDDYKFIFEKMGKQRKLYDVVWDKAENNNLAYPEIYDTDRKQYFSISQRIYYTKWEKSFIMLKELESIKNQIWRNSEWYIELFYKLQMKFKILVIKILKK